MNVRSWASSKPYTVLGLILTALYGCAAGTYVATHWAALSALAPNGIGDFTAGVCSPLAFLWLVCGYFQQGVELRHNTDALRMQGAQLQLQVEELRASVQQQSALVEVTRAQHLANQEELQHARAAKQLEGQPLFVVVKAERANKPTGVAVLRYQLFNSRAPAFAVTVKPRCDSDPKVSVASGYFEVWNSGQTQDLSLVIPGGGTPGVTLQFNFRDADNQKGTFELDLATRTGFLHPQALASAAT